VSWRAIFWTLVVRHVVSVLPW